MNGLSYCSVSAMIYICFCFPVTMSAGQVSSGLVMGLPFVRVPSYRCVVLNMRLTGSDANVWYVVSKCTDPDVCVEHMISPISAVCDDTACSV